MKRSLHSALLLPVVLCGLVAVAHADTLTPSYLASTPYNQILGYGTITYGAQHMGTGTELRSGDGFTIFDVYAYGGVHTILGVPQLPPGTCGTLSNETCWSVTTQNPGSPYGTLHPINDSADLGLVNLNFNYFGPTVSGGFFGVPFVPFIIRISSPFVLRNDDWLSQDHTTTGSIQNANGDTLVSASVPDGGAAAALLGMGLLAIGGLRRRLTK